MSRTFHLVNKDVCIRLHLHGEDLRDLLLKNNWFETEKIADADIIFVNTCSFIKKAEDKALAGIESIISKKRDRQEVVVFGCLPDISPERLKKVHSGISLSGRDLEGVIKAFGLEHFERSVGHKVYRPGSKAVRVVKNLNRFFFKDDYFTYLYDKEKVFHLKISEGCYGQCTYCAEKNARGSLRSKRISEIMAEFAKGLEQGYRIFSLNADDVGVFGRDNLEDIAQLLEKMLAIDKDFRLVITEFNPWALWFYEEKVIDLLTSPKIIFVTVPLESGSQKVLEAMRRPYLLERVLPLLARIKKGNPKIKINTHIIVGFPGETEEDFQETLRLFDKFYFNKVKIFKYSERQGTLAASMPDKICEEEKERRSMILSRKVLVRAVKRFDLKAIVLNKVGF